MVIRLPSERQAQLEALARTRGEDPVAVATELLALGIEQQERISAKKREIGEKLERRWDDYQSGRSVPLDGEEVFARLRRRGSAAEAASDS